jgi:hypothetical protein
VNAAWVANLLVGFAAVGVGCAPGVSLPATAPAAFEVQVGTTSMPIANIGGRELLVDSGATVHAVRTSARGPTGAWVRDAHGAPVGADRLDAPAVAGVAGPWFGVAGLTVPGVLSPQAMLAFGQAAELDLRAGILRVHDDPRVAAGLVARGTAPLELARCGQGQGPLYTVDVVLAGERVRMLVDTGSARTSVLLRSATAARVRKWPNYPATVADPSGRHAAWVVLAVPLSVAHLETDIDLVVTDDPEPCDVEGALGVDVLRSCDVVLMRTSGAISCG